MNEDRRIGTELRRLGAQDWQPPAGGAAAAVRSARRRTGAAVGGLAAAVATVALAVPLALGGDTVAAPLPPASAEVATPSPPPSPAPVPTGSVVVTEPSPVASETAVAVPGEAASPSPVVVEPMPPQRLVVEDGGDGPTQAGTLVGLSVAALGTDVLRQDGAQVAGGGTTWLSDPCGDGTAVGDELRTGFFSAVASNGSDTVPSFEVATYPDAATASAALAGLLDEVERCRRDLGSVWRVWDGSAAEGTAHLVSYDAGAPDDPDVYVGFGTRVRLGVEGSSLVVVGAGGLYVGTQNAVALGDTRPEVGPVEQGWPREAVDEAFVGHDARWAALRDDVVAHLDERAP